ncbi:CCA tRNA nucleotidyltransferase [Rhizobium sp. L1K21]|uniref:CCA tRNA nucleotidyltransferase n=1 Tax=Rhizobium sp. L1K21 TaxID=2954933 RepID=UPI00209395A8|nr:CCA tRNA nucleotidyltransferase [Rhizobium sp. L1K21]MCO6185432.1 CCA tRNA nucleotidyltransferase [Rhizobium sp. L1K21]
MVSVAQEDWFNEPRLKRVMDLLNGDGGEARVAGGAVRNALMGLPISDVDIATTLLPQDVVARAEDAGLKAVPTGIEHGTVTLVVEGRGFEVTTLRRDVETFGRHAEVAFGTDWRQDAERRDLTMNALYADAEGQVIDLVDGIADVETRTVRFIGEAEDRIREDYLRILRFFRFFAHYGSGRPDASALKAIARTKEGISKLSAERVWQELKKLLAAEDPGRALLWMRTTGVLTLVLPESEKWGIDEVPALVDAGRAFGWKPDPLFRLAGMVPPDSARLSAMAERLRMSKAEAGFFERWAAAPEIADDLAGTALDRMLYRYGPDGILTRLRIKLAIARAKSGGDIDMTAKVARLSELVRRAENWSRPQFPISGADMIALGVTPGPQIGEILGKVEDAWVERNFSGDRDMLLERAKALLAKPD